MTETPIQLRETLLHTCCLYIKIYYVLYFYVAVVREEPLKQTRKTPRHYHKLALPASMVSLCTEKPAICCQSLAACGQEPVNAEASATKADHEMSQIKKLKVSQPLRGKIPHHSHTTILPFGLDLIGAKCIFMK